MARQASGRAAAFRRGDAHHIPGAVRPAVQGLILVAPGEGVVMDLLLRLPGAPAPVSLSVVALISVAAPAPTSVISLAVFAAGRAVAVVFVPGTVTLLLAENLLRSILANGSFDIPFCTPWSESSAALP